jgi:regulatory protein
MNKNQQKLTNYCYDLLARRRYTIREMVRKLEARNHKYETLCTDQELQELLEALVKANLLNDRDYANFHIDAQLRTKPVGKTKIRMQLRRKGIEESIITQALNLADLDELALARQLLTKKVRPYSSAQLSDQKIQARLLRYLASNGFRGDVCYKALKDLCPPHQFDPTAF